jgi:chloramphenicol 3-O-phosphotransferase
MSSTARPDASVTDKGIRTTSLPDFPGQHTYRHELSDYGDLLGRYTAEREAEGVTVMGLFKRSRSTKRADRKPTWRERRAAERTAKAEVRLQETEHKIHEVADQIRGDLGGTR